MSDSNNGPAAGCYGIIGLLIALCIVINIIRWLTEVAIPNTVEAAQKAGDALSKAAEEALFPSLII